jgi:hypothetical protein
MIHFPIQNPLNGLSNGSTLFSVRYDLNLYIQCRIILVFKESNLKLLVVLKESGTAASYYLSENTQLPLRKPDLYYNTHPYSEPHTNHRNTSCGQNT